jgi:rhodanese-related sulfurtransferase
MIDMRTFSISAWLILGLVGVGVASSTVAGKKESFRVIKTAELTQMMENTPPGKLSIYDANGEDIRKDDGIIPGAKLLSSHGEYDVATELPTDKKTKLVFYCYNEKCTASHTAAQRAIKAHFSDVSVLSDGIVGWKKSGQKVVKP